ncbi:MAG: type II secretion system protein [Candidatus Sumerlaeia bacterium]|nr:type II secretion system protein [Candidatus Sumerlaeia bacterium]
MSRSFQTFKRRRQGFTLVEIIIVGVLIAGFSSLAIFAIREQFEANKTKATIGEARQIATALEFANIDTGIFPKLSFLTESLEGLQFYGNEFGSGAAFFSSLDVYGRQTLIGGVSPELAVSLRQRAANRIVNDWRGPYFALSATRRGFAQGRGGYAYMLSPDLPTSGPNSPDTSQGLRWPTDPNNNPYVVYMLDRVVESNVPTLAFVSEVTGVNVTRKGNYVNAVVSYGRNGYPGGEPIAADDVPINIEAMENLRLYTEVPDTNKGLPTFRQIAPNQYNRDRANIWSAQFANANGVPLPQRAGGITSPAGIADPTSDDIVFEF